jgi:hypothetical protein
MQKLNSTATLSKKECISQEKRKLNNSKVHLLKDYEHKGCHMEWIHFQETTVPSVCESFILLVNNRDISTMWEVWDDKQLFYKIIIYTDIQSSRDS